MESIHFYDTHCAELILFYLGGKSRSGSPILTFPDNPGISEVSESTYRHIVNYLTSIPA